MSVFVPNFECDVYISFARSDRQRLASGEAGFDWVASLIERLDLLVGQKLGCKDWGEIWCSSAELNGDLPLGTEHRLSHTAILLVILSEDYLSSRACAEELAVFERSVGGGRDLLERIVVVELGEIERGQWPKEIRHLLTHPFFTQPPDNGSPNELGANETETHNRLYSTRVDDLSTDLAIRLRRLRAKASADPPADEKAVFLSDATADLTPLRDSVKRYLIQDGFRVLPEHWYPRDAQGFRDATLTDLEQAILFVQLLGPGALKKSADLPRGYDGLQHDCAKELDKPILRWRSPDLDVSSITDEELRIALTRENVIAVGIEEFKRKVVERANRESTPPASTSEEAYVVVNANDVDLPLANQVGDALSRRGLACDVESQDEIPLETLAASHACFGGLLIVYGECPAIWVRQQLWRYRKAMARSELAPPVCAVYEGPPKSKDPLRFQLPTMKVIDCRSRIDESALDSFITAVRGRCSE